MSDDVIGDILSIFEITQNTAIEFKELYGFTFVFKTKIFEIRGNVTSAEIKPLGIIYDENGEYYFAPLYKSVNMNEIAKEYVNHAFD